RRAEVVYRPVFLSPVADDFIIRAELSSSTPDPPDPRAQVTILVEEGPGLIAFDKVELLVREDAGTGTLRVIRMGGSVGEVAVSYTVVDGTAGAGSDYSLQAGEIRFADGVTQKTLEVPIVTDGVAECNEHFFVRLLSASGGANLIATNATVRIVNGDSRPAGLVAPVAHSYTRPGAMVEGSEAPAGSADG